MVSLGLLAGSVMSSVARGTREELQRRHQEALEALKEERIAAREDERFERQVTIEEGRRTADRELRAQERTEEHNWQTERDERENRNREGQLQLAHKFSLEEIKARTVAEGSSIRDVKTDDEGNVWAIPGKGAPYLIKGMKFSNPKDAGLINSAWELMQTTKEVDVDGQKTRTTVIDLGKADVAVDYLLSQGRADLAKGFGPKSLKNSPNPSKAQRIGMGSLEGKRERPEITEARRVISLGAPADIVKKRLEDAGIEVPGDL